jgi:hypothetical protein
MELLKIKIDLIYYYFINILFFIHDLNNIKNIKKNN